MAAFSPVKSTWIREIQKAYFQSWPGLTVELVKKYTPNSMDTEKGHIHQMRQICGQKIP